MSVSSHSPLTTHVLDTSLGLPAKGLMLHLARLEESSKNWRELSTGYTNADGRCPGLLSPEQFSAGTYKVHFETGNYWQQFSKTSFYPYVEIVFTITDPNQKYHIPLLLTPFSYTTYRGS